MGMRFSAFIMTLATAMSLSHGIHAEQPQATAPTTAPVSAAPDAAPADWTQYSNPYLGEQNQLANANRSTDEIITWTRSAVTEALTFTPENFNARATEIRPLFSDAGWNQYVAYLRDRGVIANIREKNFSLSTIVDGDISITGRGAVAGTYRWQIAAPLLMTFHAKNPSGDIVPTAVGNYRLDLQVGRSAQTQSHDGMVIEGWAISATPSRLQ